MAKHWLDEKKDKFQKLSEHIDRLEKQREFLLKALSEQAVGLISNNCRSDWGISTKLQFTAAESLKKAVTDYSVGKKPDTYWY